MEAMNGELRRADGSQLRVLVVDDETALAELVSMALRFEGWAVRCAADGVSAVREAKQFRPDAVVLDIMLPDLDGLEVLRRLRMEQPEVPVLFLTAKDAVEDRIAGLTVGGDDYVTKPFSVEELVLRVRSLLRRSNSVSSATSSQLVVGELTLDQDSIVELYISYLRKKIDAGREPMIHTMRGAGYVLRPTG
jgi:two-component system OmpR family response regulator